MFKFYSAALFAMALAISAANAFADTQESSINGKSIFSYNYVETSLNQNIHGNDLLGLDVKGSFAVIPNLSLQASLAYATESEQDAYNLTGEAVFHMPVGIASLKNTDFLAHGGLEYSKYNYGWHGVHDKDDEFGLILGVGLRHQLIKNLEVFTDLSLHTVFADKFTASMGAIYALTPMLQLGGEITVGRVDTLSATLRFNF